MAKKTLKKIHSTLTTAQQTISSALNASLPVFPQTPHVVLVLLKGARLTFSRKKISNMSGERGREVERERERERERGGGRERNTEIEREGKREGVEREIGKDRDRERDGGGRGRQRGEREARAGVGGWGGTKSQSEKQSLPYVLVRPK